MSAPIRSRIIDGKVMHLRHAPVKNGFTYPVFALLINLDELARLDSWLFASNRFRPLALWFKDHGDGDGGHPRQWVERLLAEHQLEGLTGPLWVQTFPRVFGYQFNPVSFWYCCDPQREVVAIIAEVNNTFGERHCYLLTPDPATGRFVEVRRDKQFYVSPFYPVEGEYRFTFNVDFDAPRVVIDYYQRDELQLNTAIWGRAKPLTPGNIARALVRQPLMTIGVIVKIHWQALRLWLRRVPLVAKPVADKHEVQP